MTQRHANVLYVVALAVLLLIGFAIWTDVTAHDADGVPCEAIGATVLDNGALLIIRECPDGRVVRDYPYPEGE